MHKEKDNYYSLLSISNQSGNVYFCFLYVCNLIKNLKWRFAFQKLFLITVCAALLSSQALAERSHSGSGHGASLAAASGVSASHVGHQGIGVSVSGHGSPHGGLNSPILGLSPAATHGIGGFPVGIYGNGNHLGGTYGTRDIFGGSPGSYLFGNALAGQGALGGSNGLNYFSGQTPGFGAGIVPGSQNLGSFGLGTAGVGLGGYAAGLNYPLPNTGLSGVPPSIGYPTYNTGFSSSAGYPAYSNGLGVLPLGLGYPVSGLGAASSRLAGSAVASAGK